MLQEIFKLTNEFGNANETTFSEDGNGGYLVDEGDLFVCPFRSEKKP